MTILNSDTNFLFFVEIDFQRFLMSAINSAVSQEQDDRGSVERSAGQEGPREVQ